MEDKSVSSASTCSDYVSFDSTGSNHVNENNQSFSGNDKLKQSEDCTNASTQVSKYDFLNKNDDNSSKIRMSSSTLKAGNISKIPNGKRSRDVKAIDEIKFRDSAFLIIFVAQLAMILLIVVKSGRFIYDVDGSYRQGVYIRMDFGSVMSNLAIAFTIASCFAASSLNLLLKRTSMILNVAILYNIIVPIFVIIFGLEKKSVLITAVGAAYIIYSIFLCSRRAAIFEFTSANFRVALVAIQNHYSLLVLAAASAILLFGWTFIWSLASVGLINESATKCSEGICEGGINDALSGKPLVYSILLLISFLWTQQVIKNIVHTCVAGTIGAWWYEENCSPSFQKNDTWRNDSVIQALLPCFTRYFGSICAGSIMVTMFQSIRNSFGNILLENKKRTNQKDSIHCCENCFGTFLQSIHDWAYTFVALYGFSYFQAGKAVSNLFLARGWTTIISDNIIGCVLFMVNSFVALSTALICLCIAVTCPSIYPMMEQNVAATAGFM